MTYKDLVLAQCMKRCLRRGVVSASDVVCPVGRVAGAWPPARRLDPFTLDRAVPGRALTFACQRRRCSVRRYNFCCDVSVQHFTTVAAADRQSNTGCWQARCVWCRSIYWRHRSDFVNACMLRCCCCCCCKPHPPHSVTPYYSVHYFVAFIPCLTKTNHGGALTR